MNISEILKDVILLERGVKKIYEDIAIEKGDDEVAKILRILANESEAHAKNLESIYGIFIKSEDKDERIINLFSLLNGSIIKIKEKALPVEVLREGIKVEEHMEHLYNGLADNYKNEEQLNELLLEEQEKGLKPSELFRKIAADERKHQKMLKKLESKIVKRDNP